MKIQNRIVCTCVAFSHFFFFQLDQMNFHIVHNCVLFPKCGWSCGSSDVLLDQMTSQILSRCESSLHYGWACAFLVFQLDQTFSGIGHKHILFLRCGWSDASSSCLQDQMTFYILSKCGFWLHCALALIHHWFGTLFALEFICHVKMEALNFLSVLMELVKFLLIARNALTLFLSNDMWFLWLTPKG